MSLPDCKPVQMLMESPWAEDGRTKLEFTLNVDGEAPRHDLGIDEVDDAKVSSEAPRWYVGEGEVIVAKVNEVL